ncbi:pancreatic lipase-related protein 2-like isoform X2 [Adelges cooleyi]|uniref:pancreatic lipase-related protein 2-like isoform X2 n=1 Tax=Adelges cooleyi TaxID=133065 RepID=UPI00217FD9B5|nr:pancreatic lipase-related protein 2-like isoform X2 [Adelges cooleyi]
MLGFHKTMSLYCVLLLCLVSRLTEAAAVDSQNIVEGTVNTVCFNGLGCLDFKPNLNAENEEPMQVFELFTRKNKENDQGQMLDVKFTETITNSNFQPKNPTKILIHGWMSEKEDMRSWMPDFKDELLKNSDSNVIFVQWKSSQIWYPTSVQQLKGVANETAILIKYLKNHLGLDLTNVHLIGHSLGAHTVGFVGKHLQGQVGRITGLDPAGPAYYNAPPANRLDYTDAQFVDVIHTGGTSRLFGLGLRKAIGHIDFYPNGGQKQPGCYKKQDKGGFMAPATELFCTHIRALQVFYESINSKCPFVANKCDSYEDFQQGKCFSTNETDLNIMGMNATKPTHPPGTKYFLTTGMVSPYCRKQYKVKLNLAKPLGYALNDNDLISNSDALQNVDETTDPDSLVIIQPSDK